MKKLLGMAVGVLGVLLLGASHNSPNEIGFLINAHGYKDGVIKAPQGLLKHPYLVPAGPYFQLFDWDMYFMSVALSYDKVSDPVIGSVENFLDYEGVNSNEPGYVPREIAPDAFWALPQQCKPFLAQASVRASLTGGDFKWIAPYYDRLKNFVSYWENSRRAKDGLFLWYNGEESGSDNNPAVSDSPTTVTEGVDLQIFMIREYQALARIAHELGHPLDEIGFQTRIADVSDKIQKLMWNEQDGLYYDIDSRTNQQIKIKTWVSFLPLWVNLPTKAQAQKLIEGHLLNSKEFWSDHGIRTVAKDEPMYNPTDGYWQGPIWVVSNYLVMHGLLNYGYQEQAHDLAHETVDMLVADIKVTDGMNECYNPETGEPTAAGDFVSWDLLSEHMQEEADGAADPTALTP